MEASPSADSTNDLINQPNQFIRERQYDGTHNNDTQFHYNCKNNNKIIDNDFINNNNVETKYFNIRSIPNHVSTPSNNVKTSNQLKKNENNPQYKLEFIVKNDKREFVKIEHVMLNKYDVSIKIKEVPTTKPPKSIIVNNQMNLSTPNETEPSLTMNVEKGNITIAPDGRYTISSGIALKKVTPNGNKVVNKEFSQIILLAPNNNSKQQTSQHNLSKKCVENASNDSNVFSPSKNPFGAQQFLQQNLSKPSETIHYLNNYNEYPNVIGRGKRKSYSQNNILLKKYNEDISRPVQYNQKLTTRSKAKRLCNNKTMWFFYYLF
uniref:Uncharacterized protein n=1 Tax=Strongyloides papillosus TaxID=174720 RepID=A0A0N5C2H4_STREA